MRFGWGAAARGVAARPGAVGPRGRRQWAALGGFLALGGRQPWLPSGWLRRRPDTGLGDGDLPGNLVEVVKGVVGGGDGGFDQGHGDLGAGPGAAQAVFDQSKQLGIGLRQLGFEFRDDLVLASAAMA